MSEGDCSNLIKIEGSESWRVWALLRKVNQKDNTPEVLVSICTGFWMQFWNRKHFCFQIFYIWPHLRSPDNHSFIFESDRQSLIWSSRMPPFPENTSYFSLHSKNPKFPVIPNHCWQASLLGLCTCSLWLESYSAKCPEAPSLTSTRFLRRNHLHNETSPQHPI